MPVSLAHYISDAFGSGEKYHMSVICFILQKVKSISQKFCKQTVTIWAQLFKAL